ncbi:MAG TPA: neutral/alkaline non-lysosomal ceramidase N-terminal domain-containing protein [Candidatus Binatia bacterium]|nr:neutral/alkaline non-lysosomal ceramidase N-terminal domain-containing protein [Candidatus Binatia bacterium]
MLEAGDGTADITPPQGVELAGFHKPIGQERVATGVRQRTSARALVLKTDRDRIAIVVLDVLGFSQDFAKRVQKRIARETSVPEKHVRVCATHTHSAPSLMPLLQWGAVSQAYNDLVEKRAAEAAVSAEKDLARADMYIGKQRVESANYNRTAKMWKTDHEFTKDSNDSERWLDTMLHTLYFQREAPKRSLVWYQFSAHPVCYADGLAGPDWPGLVANKMEARDNLIPAYLQGHCGDVNPGESGRGDAEKVSEAVYAALHHAVGHSEHVPFERIQVATKTHELEFDMELFKRELEDYRKDPPACTKGEWVDAGFAKAWFEHASKWNLRTRTYSAPISAMRFGDLALMFHPSELYSVYGLTVRRESPFENTIVVGYADDMVGYIPDPVAYEKAEYAAIVVPKLIGFPPFKPDTGRKFADGLLDILKSIGARAARREPLALPA